MSVGDLSPDQAAFVDAMASATGIERKVFVAWVGCETGWGTTKPNHNYLNVGPGETYASTAQAANRAAGLLNNSTLYKGIRDAKAAGGPAVIRAIGASPWGSNVTCIGQVYGQLGGVPDPTGGAPANPADVTLAKDPVTSAVGSVAAGAIKATLPAIEAAALALVFSAAAFGLIALGLFHLTDTSPAELYGKAQSTAGTAATVAALA